MHGAIDVLDRQFVRPALDADIAFDAAEAGRAALEIQGRISGLVRDVDLASLMVHLDVPAQAVDRDATAPRSNGETGVVGDVNIHVDLDTLVAGAFDIGVEYEYFSAGVMVTSVLVL